MTRRETLLRFSGIGGLPLVLGSCNMAAVNRAEANLGWRMKRPGTGVQFTGIPEVVKVIILATYPATPQQTHVAEQHARRAVASIAKKQVKHTTVARTKTTDKAHTNVVGTSSGGAGEFRSPRAGGPFRDVSGTSSGGGQEAKVAVVEETKAAATVLKEQTGSPVIAVDTQADNRLKGERAVMLWNTQTQRFVGNNVYDISSPPAEGQVAQWGSTTARYVGSGSL
jgi:hypothetical protein